MKRLNTKIEIKAPPETVWEVLTDFRRYPEWSTFIETIEGEPLEGSRLRVRIHPPMARPMTFRPRILVAEPYRELCWLGRVLLPGLFDGTHRFKIQQRGEGSVRFIQEETFRGIMSAIIWKSMRFPTESGFKAFNAAIKKRAEAIGAGRD